ncbi:MAG: HYR domain-containing protein [Planctomycetota bacterium]
MSHNIAALQAATSLRVGTAFVRGLLVFTFFIFMQWLPATSFAQCATEATNIGAGATHVDLDGTWAARGSGSDVELLREEAGTWSSFQSIPLGDSLSSLSLDSEVLAIGIHGQVQIYAYDGVSWILEETLNDTEASYGSSLSLSNGTLGVGAPDVNSVHFYSRLFNGAGAAVWMEATTVTGDPGDFLGFDISLAGDFASVTAPGASEVRTYQFSGLQQNEWSLLTSLPYDGTAGLQISLDFFNGELRLLTPTHTGAEVRLMSANLWIVDADGALTFDPSAGPLVIAEDKVLVGTTCGMRLYSRTAAGWNNGVVLATFDETLAVPCAPIPGGAFSEPMAFGGSRAIIAETSATWVMDEFSYADCNNNGVPDRCDLDTGFPDCNGNGIPDSCDFANGDQDCNGNGIIDFCEVAGSLAPDCNSNGIPDSCDLAAGVNYDTLPPLIADMPADLTVQIASGECQGIATWNEPSASDVCSGVTLTSDFASGSSFSAGDTVVTYTATDDFNNQTQASFVVTVQDPDAPSFTFVPGNVTFQADPLTCGQMVLWEEPIAVDAGDCSAVTITSSFPQGSTFGIGTSAVVFIATDVSGNDAVAVMQITVLDNSPPVISQLPDLNLPAAGVVCSAIATWAPPFITDCSGVSVVSDAQPPIQVPVGGRIVNYTATDGLGQTSTMSFAILVEDTDLPFILNMPANMTLNPEPGTCGATILWDEPEASDNCAVETLTSNFDPPSTFGVGTTMVTYTATDTSGNERVSSFSVTITDPDFPQFISSPGDLIIGTADEQCGSIVEWTEPQAIDCSSNVDLTSSHQSGDFFVIGTTAVTYTATDVGGKSTDLSFLVTVSDGFAPTFVSAPADVAVAAVAGLCSATATWDEPVLADACSGFSVVSSHDPGTSFPAGHTQVTYTATDGVGNLLDHTFFVTVSDGEGPTFDTEVDDITVPSSVGVCAAQVFWTEPLALDNCTAATVVSSHSPGSFFDVGTTMVSYTASDGGGDSATQSFTITVTDNEAPDLFQMPANIVVPNITGTCAATATWNPPTAFDHCDEVTSTGSLEPGSSFPVGDTEVSYTSTDLSGNQAVEVFTVTVLDQEAPFFTSALPDLNLGIDQGLCTAVAEWNEPTADDICGATTLDSNHPSGTAFPLGLTTVTYTASDESGNTDTMSFTVTVVDDESPEFIGLPVSFDVGTAEGTCSATVLWSEPFAQDCALDSMTSDHENGAVYPLGDTVVTYTAEDLNGNESTGSFTITVVDDVAPEYISFPPGVLVGNETGTCSSVVIWDDVDAQDNCSIPTIVLSHTSGDVFDLGVTIVQAIATDAAGVQATRTFTVTVMDMEDPTLLTAPTGPIVVDNPTGACELPATWDAPTFSDICTAELTITSSHQPGDLFPVGDTTVSYIATDDAQNDLETSFVVTILDTTPPEILQMPPTLQVSTSEDSCEAIASWEDPTTSDCSQVTATSDIPNGSSVPIGNHVVTYTFTDEHGNSASDNFLVTVIDGELPSIDGLPDDITVTNGADSCGVAVVWAEVTTSDCTFSGLEVNFSSGSEFLIGTTTVTYTATDSEGNQNAASFLVIVEDIEAPTLFDIPADQEVLAPEGACEATASWLEPAAMDCVSYEMASDAVNGGSFPIGENLVTYTATDPSGNIGIGTFTITVLDQESPSITQLSPPIQVNSIPGTCHGVATWSEPSASDCSGILTLLPSMPSGSEFPVGATTVTYTATDGSGNIGTAGFTVTVIDVGDPVIFDLPGNASFDNIEGNCAGIATWETPQVDDCSEVILTSNYSSGNVFPLGTHVVTYTAEDAAGNTSDASFEVTIEDSEAPFFVNLPAELNFFTSPNQCDGIATWAPPIPADLCGGATFTSSHESGTVFPIGTTDVTHTATDAAGNSADYVTSIHMLDGQVPEIQDMPSNMSLDAPLGSCTIVVSWTPPTVNDCTEVDLTASVTPGSEIGIGVHFIVYTATDAQGNISESFFTVTILDVESPLISDMPDDLVLTNDFGSCGAVVSWTEPSATDCSELVSVSSSMSNGSYFDAGTTEVVYTAVDSYGNEASSSFSVNVVDKDAPVISGLPNVIEIPSYPGQCGANAFWSDPVITDNCAVDTVQSSMPAGSFFPVGQSSVLYIALDVNGNAATHEVLVTVSDTESPQIVNIPAPIVLLPNPITCTAMATWLELEFIDNCSGGSITTSVESGTTFPAGVTAVEVTAIDEYGNTTVESFTVTVEECQASFLRGDTNDDGTYDISDAIYVLGYIFSGAAEPTCMDALDENDDGQVQIADAIYHFSALFMGGAPPASPWLNCGSDPTPDSLDCESYQSCP